MPLIKLPQTPTTSAAALKEVDTPESSVFAKLSYDSSTFQLTATFKSGTQHVYFFVFPAVAEQLFQSPSKGKFFTENIKGKNLSFKTINRNTGPQFKNPEGKMVRSFHKPFIPQKFTEKKFMPHNIPKRGKLHAK
jgi:hypothetical protein